MSAYSGVDFNAALESLTNYVDANVAKEIIDEWLPDIIDEAVGCAYDNGASDGYGSGYDDGLWDAGESHE